MSRLEQLHKVQIFILKEIKRICEKFEIEYFLDSGTLLGAVRHKGFIPWDDDIDIGMTIDNYFKFLEAADKDMNSAFFIDNYYNNKGCATVFTKIRLKNTRLIELKGAAGSGHNEIFVDIFPYYFVSDNYFIRKMDAWKMILKTQIFFSMSGGRAWAGENIFKRIKFIPIEILAVFSSKEKIFKKLDLMITRYKDTGYMCSHSGGGFYTRWCFPAHVFSEFTFVEFENELYPAPKRYDEYLSICYGRYMTIQREEERVTHNIIDLDFGKYGSLE